MFILHLKPDFSRPPSSRPIELAGYGTILVPVKSPLAVLRRAWRIVSIVSSPCCWWEGLPMGLRTGLMSKPLIDVGLLPSGGVVTSWEYCEDNGERAGDGERGSGGECI